MLLRKGTEATCHQGLPNSHWLIYEAFPVCEEQGVWHTLLQYLRLVDISGAEGGRYDLELVLGGVVTVFSRNHLASRRLSAADLPHPGLFFLPMPVSLLLASSPPCFLGCRFSASTNASICLIIPVSLCSGVAVPQSAKPQITI